MIKNKYVNIQNYLTQNFLGKEITDNDIKNIVELFNTYEKENLAKINKLNRKRMIEASRINGALKQTINSHGPITKVLIGSATKRILGSLLVPNKQSFLQRIKTWFKNKK